MATPDLSKLVSLIMENPRLIEEISKLGEGSEAEKTEETELREPISIEANKPNTDQRKSRRSKLLNAIKEYLSPQRARAIETMSTLLDVIDLTGGV